MIFCFQHMITILILTRLSKNIIKNRRECCCYTLWVLMVTKKEPRTLKHWQPFMRVYRVKKSCLMQIFISKLMYYLADCNRWEKDFACLMRINLMLWSSRSILYFFLIQSSLLLAKFVSSVFTAVLCCLTNVERCVLYVCPQTVVSILHFLWSAFH